MATTPVYPLETEYKRELLSPMVSAAIVLIVVTNCCILYILGRSTHSASELFSSIWPFALPSNVAVVLMMSTLYHTVREIMEEIEIQRMDAARDAQHDPLTKLANKRLLQDRTEQAITEQILMDDCVDSGEQLERLRQYGFRLTLDDFGTGYSSLSFLRRFRVDRLKLDRSFALESDL